MAKKLKKFNGKGFGRKYQNNYHFYVAAHSQAHAAELVSNVCGFTVSVRTIRDYYSNCWGTPMDGISPTEPCLYAAFHCDKPIRIL